MLHVAPDLSGVIPLNAFEAQAASVRDLAAGVMDVSGVAGEGGGAGRDCDATVRGYDGAAWDDDRHAAWCLFMRGMCRPDLRS